jgi:hypothetical protein
MVLLHGPGLKLGTVGRMEEQKSEHTREKRKTVRWEYVFEPVNKPTYWDHVALSTEGRRRREKETESTTTPEWESVSSKRLMAPPIAEGSEIEDDDDDDNVPIYKLLQKTASVARLKTPLAEKRPREKKKFKGVRCAERGGSSMLLWQHEFYFVLERDQFCRRLHAPPKPYLYQALEFRNGSDLPEEAKVGLTRKELCEMWVLGVAYAPADHVRMYGTRDHGYLFHNDFNDTDARTGLFWRCPEVVRVDNSQAWRKMSKVLLTIPRVVHPDDVYSGALHVAGRDLHYVCGMCAHENIEKQTKEENKQVPWGFVLTKTVREEDGVEVKHGFCMYPEERLGMHLNSASMMWERVEMLFQGVRSVMRDNGRARSGSFTMEWSASLHEFWKVTALNI